MPSSRFSHEVLINSEIRREIEAYSREDCGFERELEPHEEYACKLRRDLERWCFIGSQRQKFDPINLWEFAKAWAWAIGPRIYETSEGEYEIVGHCYHKEDHIQFAIAMYTFYSHFAATV